MKYNKSLSFNDHVDLIIISIAVFVNVTSAEKDIFLKDVDVTKACELFYLKPTKSIKNQVLDKAKELRIEFNFYR